MAAMVLLMVYMASRDRHSAQRESPEHPSDSSALRISKSSHRITTRGVPVSRLFKKLR